MKDYKAKKLLESFTAYCKQYPDMRFWQALRNWAEFAFIHATDSNGDSQDTFYWENKNE